MQINNCRKTSLKPLSAICILLSLMLFTSPVHAVGHIRPGVYPNAKQDMVHQASRAQIGKFGSPRAAIIGTASGTKNVAVICVQFPVGNSSLISGSRSFTSGLTNGTVDSYFT